MNAAIQKRLHQTPQEYEMMILSIFNKWCAEKTATRRGHQKAMTTPALFNWFKRELRKHEIQFLRETEAYNGLLDKSTAREYYAQTIIPIFKYFSRPLMPKNKTEASDNKSTIHLN